MILDEFMGGFVFKLIQQKWDRGLRRLHWKFRVLDIITRALARAVCGGRQHG